MKKEVEESGSLFAAGKRVLLGVMGGVAAYKSCEIARGLVKQGVFVTTCLTEAAQKFVTPLQFESLTRSPCLTNPFPRLGTGSSAPFPHITPAQECDLLLIAPLTADGMFKFACGAAFDLLSTLVLSTRSPRMGCPAMNPNMWNSPAVQRNRKTLEDDGWLLLGPEEGLMACGDTGMGRMTEPDAVVAGALEILAGGSKD